MLTGSRSARRKPSIDARRPVTGFHAAWARRLVARAAPDPGERVLDLGDGAIGVARYLPDATGAATWVDGAGSLPSAAGAFDLCLSLLGLPLCDDQLAVLAAIHRLLAPGGRFAAVIWCAIEHNPAHRALAACLESAAADRRLLEGLFAMPEPALIETSILCAGFDRVRVVTESIAVQFSSAADLVDGLLADLGAAGGRHVDRRLQARLIDELGDRLGSLRGEYGVLVVPGRAHIAMASP